MKDVHGKTQGLKASQVRRLERLQQRGGSSKLAVEPALARALAEAAADLARPVGVLCDRKGGVTDVIVGDGTRLYLPDIGRLRAGPGRLRGLRLIVGKPERDSRKPLVVDDDFLTDLLRLKLDAVVVVESKDDGLPARIAIATILPDSVDAGAADHEGGREQRHRIERYAHVNELTSDFGATLASLEEELARTTLRVRDAAKIPGERDVAILVGVQASQGSGRAGTEVRAEAEASMRELEELARTAGVRVVDSIIQLRPEIDGRTVVGSGKLEEICLMALHKGAEMIIFDRDLSPSQLNAITDVTDLKIVDRTMLILDIFARRAASREGRMQVELAQLRYSVPRLAKKQTGLSRLTGGIGGQGPGETKLEIDRRRARDRITRLEREIDQFSRERQLRRKRRDDKSVPILAIVGYTNAGKSTLLNRLCGADVYAANELFATLDTTSRRLRFPEEREVVLTDTVGFIRELPDTLVNAFRATLEELHEADLLIHVVDASDERHRQHMEAVEKVLEELGVMQTPRLLVFNKVDDMKHERDVDRLLHEAEARRLGAVRVSALTGLGCDHLVNRMAEVLWQEDKLKTRETWAP